MRHIYRFFFLLIPVFFQAAIVETFYGPINVEEPVLLELIESSAFQRLKLVRQYGVSYYITHKEEYNRYEHSLGVFALLREKQASLEEQIAGLLHDVSHTVFSHVGDYIFAKENQDKDYQTSIHEVFLEERGLGDILRKYNFRVDQVLPTHDLFPALEQDLPNLCADRIDYNIQGAYYQGFLSLEEARQIFKDLQFIEGSWVSSDHNLMKKLSLSSLFMTQNCWGSATNNLASHLLAEAMLKGLEVGIVSLEDIHFGTDQVIWNFLMQSENAFIRDKMNQLLFVKDSYQIVEPVDADLVIKCKFRGIDPWIRLDGKKVRLTEYDPLFFKQYMKVQSQMKKGWSICFNGEIQ